MNKSIKLRLIVMNVIQWAVWGAYLTSMGQYLGSVGLGSKIGIFYAMQGIVSMFMPTLMGIVGIFKNDTNKLIYKIEIDPQT